MKMNDLKKEIKEVIEHQLYKIESMANDENTQVVATRLTAENFAEILTAVLQRIEGDRIALSFYK